MQKHEKCKNCYYRNTPMCSIISQCDSCGTTGHTITTTATSINGSCNYSTTHLHTAKEYREAANKIAYQFTCQWSEPKYQCPECGGGMCKNLMVTLTTYPAQYEYQCDKCGHREYQSM